MHVDLRGYAACWGRLAAFGTHHGSLLRGHVFTVVRHLPQKGSIISVRCVTSACWCYTLPRNTVMMPHPLCPERLGGRASLPVDDCITNEV
jgi:hypothetical protein